MASKPLFSVQTNDALVSALISKFRFNDGVSFHDFITDKSKRWNVMGGGMHSNIYTFGKEGVNYLVKHIHTFDPKIPYDVEEVKAEINALIKLKNSPRIVNLLAAEVYADEAFLLFPRIEGQTLDIWLTKPHYKSEKLRVSSELLKGLQEIHMAGLLHRDFKPDNIFVPYNIEIPPFYLDFGIVVAIDAVAPSKGTVAGEMENYSLLKQNISRNTDPLAKLLVLISRSEEIDEAATPDPPPSPTFSPFSDGFYSGGSRTKKIRKRPGPGYNRTRGQRRRQVRTTKQ
jgi:serine/threonine protein kinase